MKNTYKIRVLRCQLLLAINKKQTTSVYDLLIFFMYDYIRYPFGLFHVKGLAHHLSIPASNPSAPCPTQVA